MQERKDDRSLGELFSELARETSTLVRQEVELAKTEMTQKATRAGRHAGRIGAGGAVAYAGLLALIAAVIIGLGDLINNYWLSALIVGLLVVGVGYFLIRQGLDGLKRLDPAPRETIDSLKEDKEWIKEQTR